ncbi:MAG: glycerophosphodiester phosphodiesterase [Actinomycetota bacterium]
MSDRRFGEDAFPLVIAHRGASSTHPENTLRSFEAALAAGAPVVEVDVRLSSDGVPVAMHDPDVSRTTDGTGPVRGFTVSELRRLNAGTTHRPEQVPLLSEVLELVSGRGGLALEVKNIPGEPDYEPDREVVVEAALSELERSAFEGPLLMLSFSLRSIEAAKGIALDIPTGYLTAEAVDLDAALTDTVEGGHDFVFPAAGALFTDGGALVTRAHEAGVRVGTWTVDRISELRTLLEWGVDAVASNDPAMAVGVVAEWAEHD